LVSDFDDLSIWLFFRGYIYGGGERFIQDFGGEHTRKTTLA
jgi:hypothetical protein